MTRSLPLHDASADRRHESPPAVASRRPRRAFFFTAPWALQHPGGGEVQLLKTAEAIESLGADVRRFDPWHDRLESADWLHLFGTLPECLAMARAAKQAGTRVALSPVSWYDPGATWRLEPTFARKLRAVTGWAARRLLPAIPSWRRTLIHCADVLLPNSHAEARQLVTRFGANPRKIVVVPNGVDPRFAHGDAWRFESTFGIANFILVPGRIEPRKNQLTVIRALAGTGLRVVILGDCHPDHAAYFDRCCAAADSDVRFIGHIDHDSPMMAAAYRAARVVVLASWFETPGLAALEGALAGANVVVTARGCAREYFGDHARYVQPDDAAGIRVAVREATADSAHDTLRATIERQYLWQHVAAQTLAAYERAEGLVQSAAVQTLRAAA
jgi:glycosyltransferase involved in cell wall biosynthesis